MKHMRVLKNHIADYLELTKPRVVLLMLITAYVGMALATPDSVPLTTIVLGLLGIGLLAGAAATVNHLVDQRIDALMWRTKRRPIPTGKIVTKHAALFAILLAMTGFIILMIWINALTAWLTFFSLVGYAGVYTLYLKRATPQNIVIGGLAGAMPPLLGWTAVTNHIDPYACLLVLIIFVWTPPHFWALAIYRHEEYAAADVPMLPVTHGLLFTRKNVLVYTILLLICSLLPYITDMNGLIYGVSALVLGLIFIYYALRLRFSSDLIWGMRTFKFSIVYLFLLFIMMFIDHHILL